MKSKLLSIILLALAAFLPAGCSDSTEGMTDITYYAVLTLEGDATVYVDKGSTYVDPGYSAEMNGEDVTDQVVVVSDVDTSTSGVYTVTYTITNDDGFSSSSTRTVVVTDPNDPVEGYWDTDANSYRWYSDAATVYGSSYAVLIINNGDGTYYVDDLLAGWYRDRAGYGDSYAMTGDIEINGTEVTLVDSYIAGWGDGLDWMEDGAYDADSGTLSWHVCYAETLEFYITMYKR